MLFRVARKNAVLIVMSALMLGLSLRPLFPDSMAQDFSSCYVNDFSCFSSAHRMTPEKQGKLLGRRIGTYGVDVSGDDIGFSFPGRRLVRLLVNISSNCTARLFFEDGDGNYVSRADFMAGRLSDTSIYWGHPEHGVAARYGIMGDLMPLLISPHQRQIPLVLKRADARIDAQSIRQEPSVDALFASNHGAADIFSRVCESDSDADALRQVSSGKSEPGGLKMVACFEERRRCKAKRGAWVCAGKSDERRYCVLMNNGGYHTIVEKGNGGYRFEPYHTFSWWNEFRNLFPCDDTHFYLVADDTMIETITHFGTLAYLDGMILTPRLAQKMTDKDGLPLDKRIEESVDRLIRRPEEFFTRLIWTRVADIPRNEELRRRLYSTYQDFMEGKEGKRGVDPIDAVH